MAQRLESTSLPDAKPESGSCPDYSCGARNRAVLAPSTTGREDRSGLTWRLAMALRIICMCGYVIQGENDDELWRNAQGHMGVLHPELVDNVTREDILAQAEQL
jgi:predicted small metal-binding protein